MLPTLRGGEFVLADVGRSPLIGDIVVATHPDQNIHIIKRVAEAPASAAPVRSGWLWLLSDNAAEGTDSRRFGLVDPESVVGVVTLVLNRPTTSLALSGAIGIRS